MNERMRKGGRKEEKNEEKKRTRAKKDPKLRNTYQNTIFTQKNIQNPKTQKDSKAPGPSSKCTNYESEDGQESELRVKS